MTRPNEQNEGKGNESEDAAVVAPLEGWHHSTSRNYGLLRIRSIHESVSFDTRTCDINSSIMAIHGICSCNHFIFFPYVLSACLKHTMDPSFTCLRPEMTVDAIDR